jgi:RimJ/RimL family protein N-acetyltransferase
MMPLHTPRLEIRPLVASEYLAAVKIYRQTPGFVVEIEGHAPESINLAMVEQEAREAAEHGALCCGVFLRGGELIGIATFEKNNHADKQDTAWIALLMIAEAFQKHGYGAEAYKALEGSIFADPAVHVIGLGVLPNNKAGSEFWRRMGYLDIEPADAAADIHRMRKTRNC